NMEVNQDPVRKVRLAQFSAASPKVARLVLDLSARAPYRIVEGSDGLKVVFGEGQAPHPAALAALRTETDAAPESAPPPAAPEAAPAPQVLPGRGLFVASKIARDITARAPAAPAGALQPRPVGAGGEVENRHPIRLGVK